MGRMLLIMVGPQVLKLKRVLEELSKSTPGLEKVAHLLEATSDGDDRLGWYAAGDVQVINSVCENFGRVLLEGMAMSLPLLATSCGGSKDIVVDRKTGLLHPPPDQEAASDAALARNILLLDSRTSAGRQLARSMGKAGCERVHAVFHPTRFPNEMEEQLLSIAAGAGSGAKAGSMQQLSTWQASFMPSATDAAPVMARSLSWKWKELPSSFKAGHESAALHVGSKLFVLGGYSGAKKAVLGGARQLDLETMQWTDLGAVLALPSDLAETNAGILLCDRRHVYMLSGQKGTDCSPAVSTSYRLDLKDMTFHKMPPLPQPRYAPATMLFDGRLHVVGGLGPDRSTPQQEHWSLGVNADGNTEGKWREEESAPVEATGSHTAPVSLTPGGAGEPRVYSWGHTSQEDGPRDVSAGNYSCKLDREWAGSAVWSYAPASGWRRHRDAPLPMTHVSMCTFKIGKDAALVVGGQLYDEWLSRTIWVYNATEDAWWRVGHTPVYVKGHVCAVHDGQFILAGGQLGSGNGADPGNGVFGAKTFVTPLPLELSQLEIRPALEAELHMPAAVAP